MSDEHQLGDGPIDPSYEAKMEAIMQAIDQFMNNGAKGDDRKVGIVVLTFPFGSDDGRCNFMSNGVDRDDIVTLFKEMIARFEGQPSVTGTV